MPGVSKDDLRRWRGFGGGVFVDMQVVERCAHCDFTVSARLEQARQAFERARLRPAEADVDDEAQNGFTLR
jgi:hypothetical protein